MTIQILDWGPPVARIGQQIIYLSPTPQAVDSAFTDDAGATWSSLELRSTGLVIVGIEGDTGELLPLVEAAAGLITLHAAGLSDVVVDGPTHPSGTTTDGSEPYEWLPSNASEIGDFFSGLTDETVLTTTIAVAVAPSWTDDTGDAQAWTAGTAIAPVVVPAVDAGSPAPEYVAFNLPDGLAFDAGTRIISGTPVAVGGGMITITATNSAGSDDWTLGYVTGAAPPVAVAPSWTDDTGDAQAWTAGTAIAPVVVPAVDAGSPAPEYVAFNLPDGLAFDAGTRIISGTPVAVGGGMITITATNSAGSDDWTLGYVTGAAVTASITDTQITSTPASGDTYGFAEVIEFTVTYAVAVDVTGTPRFPMNLNPSPTGAPEYADYARHNGANKLVFEWIVSATDEDDNGIFFFGETDSQNRGDIVLNGGTIQHGGADADLTTLHRGTKRDHKVDGSLVTSVAPSWTDDTGDAQAWTAGTAIAPVVVPAVDAGSPAPEYVAFNLPDGLAFDAGTRIISGTPVAVGGGMITITATNSAGSDDWTLGYVTGAAPPVAVAPSWTDDTGDAQAWTAGTAIAPVVVPAVDAGSPAPEYVAFNLPDGLAFDAGTRIISGTPVAVGGGMITITATNSAGSDDWTLGYVTGAAPPVAVAPSWTDDTGDAQAWTAGTAIAPVVVPAVDAGSPAPEYVAFNLPDGLAFDAGTRIISGTPVAVGGGMITITATNSAGSDDWTLGYVTGAAPPVARREQTVPLPANRYETGTTWFRWDWFVNRLGPDRPEINPGLRDADPRFVLAIGVHSDGEVDFQVSRVVRSNADAGDQGDDLTTAFEVTGSLEITAGEHRLLVAFAGADRTEPYLFTPANSGESRAFYNAVSALPGDQVGSLVIRDFVPVDDPIYEPAVSDEFRTDVYARASGAILVVLLTLRLVLEDGTTDTVRLTDAPRGFTSRGEDYQGEPIDAGLPSVTAGGAPRVTLRLDHVDRAIGQRVRQMITGTGDLELVISSRPSMVERAWTDLVLGPPQWELGSLTLDLGYEAAEREPYPGIKMTPETTPGVF